MKRPEDLHRDPGPPDRRVRVAQAWAVHAFTASGAVLGFLAFVAVMEGDVVAVFMWLGLALFVDAIDGTLARRAGVTEFTPGFDGAILDNIIDYFTYVAVPAMMVYWFGFVPPGWEIPAAAAIMGASCYTFANVSMKTSDYWFSGFPALWNLVVLYFHILGTDPWTNLAVIGVCLVLTFVPIKYVHPFRVRSFRAVTIPVMVLWAATTLRLTLSAGGGAPASALVFWLWVGSSVYFAGLSVWRTVWPERFTADET